MMKNKEILFNNIKYYLIIPLILLVLSLVFFEKTNFDVALQNYFFDFENMAWMVDSDEPIAKFFFYKLPKILLGIFIVVVIVEDFWRCGNLCNHNWIASSLRFLAMTSGVRSLGMTSGVRSLGMTSGVRSLGMTSGARNGDASRNNVLILFGIIFVLLIAGNIKKFTNVYCPKQLEIYGAEMPYIKHFEKYPPDFVQIKKGQCFPGGHVVTAFCLYILFFIYKKKIWLFVPTVLGWALGLYQMMKGAHFFSDNFVSMILCFMLSAFIVELLILLDCRGAKAPRNDK